MTATPPYEPVANAPGHEWWCGAINHPDGELLCHPPEKGRVSSPDRTVHAESEGIEVVRYDRAGKWYVEPKTGEPRYPVTLSQAVAHAKLCASQGGTIYRDRPGGMAFDARLRGPR